MEQMIEPKSLIKHWRAEKLCGTDDKFKEHDQAMAGGEGIWNR